MNIDKLIDHVLAEAGASAFKQQLDKTGQQQLDKLFKLIQTAWPAVKEAAEVAKSYYTDRRGDPIDHDTYREASVMNSSLEKAMSAINDVSKILLRRA